MSEVTDINLQRTLGRMEQALTDLTREVRTANELGLQRADRHEIRITELERKQLSTKAFAAGISATVTLLFALAWRMLSAIHL